MRYNNAKIIFYAFYDKYPEGIFHFWQPAHRENGLTGVFLLVVSTAMFLACFYRMNRAVRARVVFEVDRQGILRKTSLGPDVYGRWRDLMAVEVMRTHPRLRFRDGTEMRLSFEMPVGFHDDAWDLLAQYCGQGSVLALEWCKCREKYGRKYYGRKVVV